jgi:hypothetical protein
VTLLATVAMTVHAQSSMWHIVQADDGTVYAVVGDQRFTLEPDPISDAKLAQLNDAGDAGSQLGDPESVPTPVAPSGGPTSTPEPPPSGQFGSRENPIPLSTNVALSDGWQLRVVSSEPNATKDILAQGSHTPPPNGTQLFLVRVELTNPGPGPRSFDVNTRLQAVGLTSMPYLPVANSCGTVPDALTSDVVEAEATVAGNICWAIQSRDAGTLVLYDSPVGAQGSERVYFALH